MLKKTIRRRVRNVSEEIFNYNVFCKTIKEGDILYNMNKSNKWGELLLVAAKSAIVINDLETYSLLLLGLNSKDNLITTNGQRVDFTPQLASAIPYLRNVGHCKYEFFAEMKDFNVNFGMIVVCKDTDLKKYAMHHSRKPRARKYGDDGKPIVKPTKNDQ